MELSISCDEVSDFRYRRPQTHSGTVKNFTYIFLFFLTSKKEYFFFNSFSILLTLKLTNSISLSLQLLNLSIQWGWCRPLGNPECATGICEKLQNYWQSGGIKDFLEPNGASTYHSATFSWKLYESEENWTGGASKILLCRSATGNIKQSWSAGLHSYKGVSKIDLFNQYLT